MKKLAYWNQAGRFIVFILIDKLIPVNFVIM